MENKENQLKIVIEYYRSNRDKSQEALVACLKEIQQIYGCVPIAAQRLVCEIFEAKPTLVSAIIKRYPSLKEASVQHELTICMGTNCMRQGSQKGLRLAEQQLRAKANGNPVKGIQLRTCQCLRQCKTSPNLLIDGTLHTSVEPEQLKQFIKDLNK